MPQSQIDYAFLVGTAETGSDAREGPCNFLLGQPWYQLVRTVGAPPLRTRCLRVDPRVMRGERMVEHGKLRGGDHGATRAAGYWQHAWSR